MDLVTAIMAQTKSALWGLTHLTPAATKTCEFAIPDWNEVNPVIIVLAELVRTQKYIHCCRGPSLKFYMAAQRRRINERGKYFSLLAVYDTPSGTQETRLLRSSHCSSVPKYRRYVVLHGDLWGPLMPGAWLPAGKHLSQMVSLHVRFDLHGCESCF